MLRKCSISPLINEKKFDFSLLYYKIVNISVKACLFALLCLILHSYKKQIVALRKHETLYKE